MTNMKFEQRKNSIVGWSYMVFFFFFCTSIFAQTISDITVQQQGQNVVIYYHLETTTPCSVHLYLSEDGGDSWSLIRNGLSGDVKKVIKGNRSIIWDVISNQDQLVGNEIVFKVRAQMDVENFRSIKIGNQFWMAENLNVDYYRNGDPIIEVRTDSVWSKMNIGSWCYHDNNPNNETLYGKLYNGYAILDERGICPIGWHVPNNEEWSELEKFVGGSQMAGGNLKSVNIWNSPNTNANNSSQFNAMPSGNRSQNGGFNLDRYFGGWWSVSVDGNDAPYYRRLAYNDARFYEQVSSRRAGFSVRCIQDYKRIEKSVEEDKRDKFDKLFSKGNNSSDGNPEYQGKSENWQLAGRNITQRASISEKPQFEGTIYLNITVDMEGNVISAAVDPMKSKVSGEGFQQLAALAKKVVLSTKFSVSEMNHNQKGSMVITFELK